MTKKLIADKNGIEPGKKGYIETIEPDTKVVKDDKEPVPRSRLNKEINKSKALQKTIDDMKAENLLVAEKIADENKTNKDLYEAEKTAHEKTRLNAEPHLKRSKKVREKIYEELDLNEEDIAEYDKYSLGQVEKLYDRMTSKGRINPAVGGPADSVVEYKNREELATAYNNNEVSEEEYEKLKKTLKRK